MLYMAVEQAVEGLTSRVLVVDPKGDFHFHYEVLGLACELPSRTLVGREVLEAQRAFSYPVADVVGLNINNRDVQPFATPPKYAEDMRRAH